MATVTRSPPPHPSPRRWRNLGESARQANHVVAAAVFAFVSSILLQYLLASPLMTMAAWIHGKLGTTGAAILGPLLVDGTTTLMLLLIAFPFGRVTAARPWVAGTALVILVHGFWFSFHFVIGEHLLLWGEILPVVGRGVLMLLTLVGVARLIGWGRRVALESDLGEPSQPSGEPSQPSGEPSQPSDEPSQPSDEPSQPSGEGEDKEEKPCKDPGAPDVLEGER